MIHGSLFNGIGGFQLAAAWMGWENIFSCEIDDFCNKVTKKHFPDCIQHGDIKTTDFTIYRGRIDIVTGGFPCQPFSTAGNRKGTDDNRYLWPEMLRAIREIQPGYVVGENVRGITNWNGGLVFDEVQSDLETSGYEVLPFLLPACAVNASHRRDRIWFIAHRTNQEVIGRNRKQGNDDRQNKGRAILMGAGKSNDGDESIANSKSNGNYRGRQLRNNKWQGNTEKNRTGFRDKSFNISEEGFTSYSQYERCKEQWGTGEFRSSPTVPSIRGRVEPGFRGGDDGFSSRVDRIKALGNAIVPQVAYEIFKAIEQTKSLTTHG